jgi:hypothetical protein
MKRRVKQIDERKRDRIETILSVIPWTHGTWEEEDQDLLIKRLIIYLESDEPLPRRARDCIAGELHRIYFGPVPTKSERRKSQDRDARWLIQMLRKDAGMKAGDAERAVAEEIGITVDALRKRLRRLPT